MSTVLGAVHNDIKNRQLHNLIYRLGCGAYPFSVESRLMVTGVEITKWRPVFNVSDVHYRFNVHLLTLYSTFF